MKKSVLFVFAALMIFASCEEKPLPPVYEIETTGAYILNNGNFASNDANLSFYNPKTNTLVSNVFDDMNGSPLGDTAQDMIVYGNKMYIAVYNSKMLFVTDRKGKILKEIRMEKDGQMLSPRCLTAYDGRVYASLYEGFLAQIDTVSMNVAITKVGNNPEGVAVSNNHIFVANSGGMNYPNYDNTVSVVDLATLREVRKITVVENPCKLLTNIKGELFLISMGNYADVPNTLQRIDPFSFQVDVLTEKPVTYMDMSSDSKIYFVSSQYDSNYNAQVTVGVYNTLSQGFEPDVVTAKANVFKNAPCCISVDPVSGDVYVGTSDYMSEGDMYRFNKNGELLGKFGTGGLNPMGTYFLLEYVEVK